MAGFNPDDYVDVAERISMFSEKYPLGSLQSEITFVEGGVLCRAHAYRTPDDERPGCGHAFEPIPGKTQFTKDSEVMNAETSAWGRAIVALGFETKKVASADEVRNRQEVAPADRQQVVPSPSADTPPPPPGAAGATDPQREKIDELRASLVERSLITPDSAAKLAAMVADPELRREKAREVRESLEKILREKAPA